MSTSTLAAVLGTYIEQTLSDCKHLGQEGSPTARDGSRLARVFSSEQERARELGERVDFLMAPSWEPLAILRKLFERDGRYACNA